MPTPTASRHRDLEQRFDDLETQVRKLTGRALSRPRLSLTEGTFRVSGTGQVLATHTDGSPAAVVGPLGEVDGQPLTGIATLSPTGDVTFARLSTGDPDNPQTVEVGGLGGDGGPTAPPTSSPDAVVAPLGVSAVLASWAPVPDAEGYDVYVSTSPLTIFDETTLLGGGTATSLAIGQLPGGVPVVPGSPVYVRVWAKNSIGQAPTAGGEGSATPRAATTTDVAADFVYAGTVEAAQVSSGNLTAALALLGSLTVGDTNGRRIVLSPQGGFSVIDGAGDPLVNFPTGAGSNTFKGDLVANALTTLGRASFRGNDNEISRNSSFTLASGTTRPSNAPLVGAFDKGLADVPPAFRQHQYLTFQDGVSTTLYTPANAASSGNQNVMCSWDFTTGLGGTVTEWNLPGYLYNQFDATYASVTKVGATFYILFWDNDAATRGWWVQGFTQTGLVGAKWQYTPPANVPIDSNSWSYYRAALSTDGADLFVAQLAPTAPGTVSGSGLKGDAALRIRKFTTGGSLLATQTTTQTWAYDTADASKTPVVSGLRLGTFDFAGPRYLAYTKTNTNGAGVPTPVVLAQSDLTLDSSLTAGWAPSSGYLGEGTLGPWSHWHPTEQRWYSFQNGIFSASNARYKFAKRSSGPTSVWLAYSWYDSDPGGTGTHETTLSPMVKFTPEMYRGVAVKLPVQPADAGDPDSPDSARWYYYRGETQPTEAQMRLLPASDSTPGQYVNMSWVADAGWLDIPTAGGSAPPVANGFPDGFAGEVRSNVGGFVVKGDGTGAWPYLTTPITDRLTATENASNLLDGRLDTLEAVNASSRLSALESTDTSLDGRLDTLEAVNASSRLSALESTDTSLDGRLDTLEADTGWLPLTTVLAGTTAQYRVRNGFASVRLFGSSTVGTGYITVVAAGGVPATARPSANIWGGAIAGTYIGGMTVGTDGSVIIRQESGSAKTGGTGGILTYPVG